MYLFVIFVSHYLFQVCPGLFHRQREELRAGQDHLRQDYGHGESRLFNP